MDVTAEPKFAIDVDWVGADGVVTPELAATWARLSVRVNGRSVTTVESNDSGVRRSIFASAYPLAEWIAYNWWGLRHEVRPSAVSTSDWRWATVRSNTWLRRHNLREAGNGMAWPDLTIVPEGAVTAIAWFGGPGLAGQPVRFLETGFAHVPTEVVETGLRNFVYQVLDRLAEAGIRTLLDQEWAAIAETTPDEADFNRAAARLGLDPFAVDKAVADDVIAIADDLEPAMLDEFLDSADPDDLRGAVRWLTGARELVSNSDGGSASLQQFQFSELPRTDGPPYQRGYELAHATRQQLGVEPSDPIDMSTLVARTVYPNPSAGLDGYVGLHHSDSVTLVVPAVEVGITTTRFAQASALGLALAGSRREYLLDPAHTDAMKHARAFAAELLAPAAGISAYLTELPAATDAAFEAIARRFETSPILVRRQYQNQIAGRSTG